MEETATLKAHGLARLMMGALLSEINRQLTAVQSLGLGIRFLKTLKNISQISAGQLPVGLPFEAGSATSVDDVGHASAAGTSL